MRKFSIQKVSAIALCINLLTPAFSFGAAANTGSGEMSDAEIHAAICSGPNAEALKDPEAKGIRESVIRFLKDPTAEARALLAQGNRDDVGPFGLLAACAMITALEVPLTASGCIADDGTKIDAQPALAACQAIFNSLPK